MPVLTEPDGTKLAKSRRSVRLESARRCRNCLEVFQLLGLGRPPSLL